MRSRGSQGSEPPKDPDRAAFRAWPFEGWFLYWSFIFILPLFSEFFLPKTVYPCKVASDEDRPLRVPPVKVSELPSDSFNNERQSHFRSSWYC